MNIVPPVPSPANPLDTLARRPAWAALPRAETAEDVAFLSGAALAQLHLVLAHDAVPHDLLRDRLALQAAEACMSFAGRPERSAEMRDALNFLRAGDLPGPAGETCLCWRRAAARKVSPATLHHALPTVDQAQIAAWLRPAAGRGGDRGGPVARCAAVFEAVLTDSPGSETMALLLANAALAQALGWDHLVPLLACGLRRGDLRKRDDDLRAACHRGLADAAAEAVRLAADLTRRVAKLEAVAPKLRAKAAGAAVALFRAQDAIAPAALPLPDRAARRLCDRLVDLGAVRELTGRETFRLYGV